MATAKKKTSGPVALTTGTTRLATYRERFLAMIASLEAHDAVKVLSAGVGDPIDPAEVDAAAARASVTLSPEERELYARMNGAWLVWVGVEAPEYDKKAHKLKKGPPAPRDLEAFDTRAFRIIALAPIEQVFGRPFDYAKFMGPGEPPRLGFDFPGQYTTPALVVRDGRVRVEVGDDHGAAWDGSSSSLEDYVETILATFGDVELRRAIYLKGKHGIGRAYFEAHPVSIESLLPAPLPKDAQAEAKLLRVLNRTYGKDLSNAQIAQAVGAMASSNRELFGTATGRLGEQPERTRVHAGKLVDALEVCLDPRPLIDLIDRIKAPLDAEQRARVLRGKGRMEARGRVAAGGGADILPDLRELLASSNDEDFRAAAYAALVLGPAAIELAPLLDARLGAPDFAARVRPHGFDGQVNSPLVAAAALMSIEPARAAAMFEHLRVIVRSDLVRLGQPAPGRCLGTEPHDLAAMLGRLSPEIQERLAAELHEVLDAYAATGSDHAGYELLGALGSAGIERGFSLLATHLRDPRSDAARYTLLGVFGGTFFRASLDAAQRARAAAIAKRDLLAFQESAGYLRAESVAFTLIFGGDTAPEIPAAAANEQLLANAGGFLNTPLCQRTLTLLRDRGIARAVLEPKVLGLVGHYNWIGQDEWLRGFAANLR
ncbi:MAG: hypothetical protein U0359_18610 [Byssovorax sp.]